MRPLQLLIAGLLGACLVLLVLLTTTRHAWVATAAPPTPKPPATADPVTIVDTACYSCGSGNGPSAEDLVWNMKLTDDERVVAIDQHVVPPTHSAALAELIDSRCGRHRSPGEVMDFEIESARARRRVVILFHWPP